MSVRFDELTLTTRRLLLRPLREADAPELFAIFSDPEVTRYWSSQTWTSIDSANAMIARDQKAMAEGESLRLGVEAVRAAAARLALQTVNPTRPTRTSS
jgi:ribosomal-protein-alanine N-acetyltransferase